MSWVSAVVTLFHMIEDVAFTGVVAHEDGEYGLFLRQSRAWEIKLEPPKPRRFAKGFRPLPEGSTT